MEKHKFIAFDLDGTVLGRDGQMKLSTAHTLSEAYKKGCIIAAATGRSKTTIPESVLQLPFLQYIISGSGAEIENAKNGEVLRTRYLEKRLADKVTDIAKASGAGVNISLENSFYFEWKSMWMHYKHQRLMKQKSFSLRQWGQMMKSVTLVLNAKKQLQASNEAIIKVEGVYPPQLDIKAELEKFAFLQGIEPVPAMGSSIEVTAKGATKGEAIAFICKQDGIAKEEVLVFGDSGNDISMRQHAGFFVAMGNASEDVKAVADYVTCNVDDDGVGKAINKLLDL